MQKEKWIIWKPMAEIPTTLYLQELKENENGLTISLIESDNSPSLIIHFDVYCSYRVTDEGDLLKTLSNIENKDCLGKSTLFTVENSIYLQWFHEQTYNRWKDNQVTHYLIATPDQVIEIIHTHSPTLMWH